MCRVYLPAEWICAKACMYFMALGLLLLGQAENFLVFPCKMQPGLGSNLSTG